MVHYLVHEVAVVADDDDASLEALQIFFEHLQSNDVEVVGGLVQHEEVGVAHQHRTEVEAAAFASAQLVDIAVLRLGREEEVLEELRGGEPLAVAQFDNFSDVLHHVDDLHLLVELKPVLRIVAETDGLADVQRAAVGLHQPHQYLDEG